MFLHSYVEVAAAAGRWRHATNRYQSRPKYCLSGTKKEQNADTRRTPILKEWTKCQRETRIWRNKITTLLRCKQCCRVSMPSYLLSEEESHRKELSASKTYSKNSSWIASSSLSQGKLLSSSTAIGSLRRFWAGQEVRYVPPSCPCRATHQNPSIDLIDHLCQPIILSQS